MRFPPGGPQLPENVYTSYSPIRLGDCEGSQVPTREEFLSLARFMLGENNVDWLDLDCTSCVENCVFAGLGLRNHQNLQGNLSNIASELRAGKVVQIEMSLEEGGNHAFCVVPTMEKGGDLAGKARVVHSYQDRFLLRGEKEFSIDEITNKLSKALERHDKKAFKEVFGSHTPFGTAKNVKMKTCVEVTQRVPVLPVYQHPADQQAMLDRVALAEKEFQEWQGKFLNCKSLALGGAFGAMSSFTWALVSEIIANKTEQQKLAGPSSVENVLVSTAKGGIGGVGAKVGASQFFVPSAEVAGGLVSVEAAAVSSASSAAGGAALAVAAFDALYGFVKYARNQWSLVDYRKSAASNLAGGAGGLLGTLGVFAGAALLTTPIGWGVTLTACAVGLGGGIGGAYAGQALDGWLWDSDVDMFVHMFWFFGLGAFDRSRPVGDQIPQTKQEFQTWIASIEAKFAEYDNCGDEKTRKAWESFCGGNLIEVVSKVKESAWNEYMSQVGHFAERVQGS